MAAPGARVPEIVLAAAPAAAYALAPPMGKLARVLAAVATALIATVVVVYMQYRFDAADRRHGLELVQGYHAHAGAVVPGRSIPELIERRHPGRPIGWSASTESSCMQHIRVRAVVIGPGGGVSRDYEFVVDINGPSIHPGNEAGRLLLGQLSTASADPQIPRPGAGP